MRNDEAMAVRDACIRAAQEAYDAAMADGLCHAGAWECAVGAMRSLDVRALLEAPAEGRNSTQSIGW